MRQFIAMITLGVILISCGSKKNMTTKIDSTTKESSSEAIKKEPMETLQENVMEEQVIIEEEVMEEPQSQPQEENIATIELEEEDLMIEKFDHSDFDAILKKYVTVNGVVDYAGIKKNRRQLTNYLTSIKNNPPVDSWSKNDKLAYYMNAYNAMTVDLILRNYPLNSIKDVKDPWNQRYWQIGEKWVNLEEIEHKILRKMNEPRIHFGINCASFSCPPLLNAAFTAGSVDNQLERLSVNFINDSKRNIITTGQVEISNIFKWFKKDFTTSGDIIDYLNKYSDVKINKKARVRYANYNWELND